MSAIRVDFYLLTEDSPQAKGFVVCRLLEKAYLRGHRVFVFCNNRQEAETLDELLWTFKELSFIPHNLQGEGPQPPPPIQIGFGSEPRGFDDILINLAGEIPLFYTRFRRIIEIVDNNEAAKEQSRAHYRQYRLNGCVLKTHAL